MKILVGKNPENPFLESQTSKRTHSQKTRKNVLYQNSAGIST